MKEELRKLIDEYAQTVLHYGQSPGWFLKRKMQKASSKLFKFIREIDESTPTWNECFIKEGAK